MDKLGSLGLIFALIFIWIAFVVEAGDCPKGCFRDDPVSKCRPLKNGQPCEYSTSDPLSVENTQKWEFDQQSEKNRGRKQREFLVWIVPVVVIFILIVVGALLCLKLHFLLKKRRFSSNSAITSINEKNHYERCEPRRRCGSDMAIRIAPDPQKFRSGRESVRSLRSSYVQVEQLDLANSPSESISEDISSRPESSVESPRSCNSSSMKFSNSDDSDESSLKDKRMPEEHKTEYWGSKESSNKERLDLLRQRFRNILYAKSKEEQLDTMFTTPDFSIGIFDHNGGYLEIPDTSVHLYIPPGALPHGSMQEVYIYLFNHSSDLAEDNITSPIIRCGPPGLQFQGGIFGVVLSFPSDHNNAQFNVFTKESEEDIARGWLNLSEQAPERCFTDGDGNVHLMLNHFSDFKTEKVPTNAASNENGLKLSAFGKPFQPGEYTFDLYVCMWNPPYQKKVDAEAARLGYFPLQDGDQLLNVKKDESVKVKLSDLKMGWQLIYPDAIEQTIQASEDHCADCKCHFNVEHIASSPGRTGGLHCRIMAYTDSQQVKLPIRVSERWKCDSRVLFGDEETKSDLACAPSNMVREDVSPQELFGETFFGGISRKISNHLSARAYYELCLELNAKRTPPTDWRLLMAELGLDEMRYIHQIEQGKEEGAVVVVNLFFSRNKGKVALQKLHEACKKVKLYRAAQILENDQECLRTNNADAQAIQLHYQNKAHPDDQHCPLPDVTQPTSPDSLSHMMSQMMLRPQGLDASPKGVNATMQKDTSVCVGSQNLYPQQTWL